MKIKNIDHILKVKFDSLRSLFFDLLGTFQIPEFEKFRYLTKQKFLPVDLLKCMSGKKVWQMNRFYKLRAIVA
jgi:hypothetical protein